MASWEKEWQVEVKYLQLSLQQARKQKNRMKLVLSYYILPPYKSTAIQSMGT